MSTKQTRKKLRYGTPELARDFGQLTFGLVLRAHREGEGLSQISMANALGISKQSLCDLERGRKIPSPGRAASIARALNMLQESFIELALQDQLRRDKLGFVVTVATRKRKLAS